MARYNVYPGEYVCHTCQDKVPTVRSYPDEKRLTWMCKNKHLTEVNLSTKKSKKDYE